MKQQRLDGWTAAAEATKIATDPGFLGSGKARAAAQLAGVLVADVKVVEVVVDVVVAVDPVVAALVVVAAVMATGEGKMVTRGTHLSRIV